MSGVSPGFSNSTETLLQTCSLLLLLSIGLVLKGRRFVEAPLYARSPFSALLVLLFLGSAVISGLGAEDRGQSLLLVGGIAICLLVSGGAWSMSDREVKNALAVYAVAAAAASLGMWLAYRESGHRLAALVHPNYWGLICFGSFCLAGLVRSDYLSAAIRLISVLVILDAQSRTALLATAVSAIITGYFRLRAAPIRSDIKAGLLVGIAVFLAAISLVFTTELTGMLTQVFLLDDPWRGGGTGFTGRTELWRAGYDLFRAHPFFGVGAGMQKLFITGFGEIDHPHNGYLNTLDQFGAIGTGIFLVLSGISSRRLWQMAKTSTPGASIGIALVCGYALEAIFEPKLLNIGNPVSVITLMFLLQPPPLARQSAASVMAHVPRRIRRRFSATSTVPRQV